MCCLKVLVFVFIIIIIIIIINDNLYSAVNTSVLLGHLQNRRKHNYTVGFSDVVTRSQLAMVIQQCMASLAT